MFNNTKVFALIPARKNSTGIKNKNIYKIDSKALIDFTLEAASESYNIDKIFVSSDSIEILDHVSFFPNIFPIKRPLKYADTKSQAVDVVNHFIEWLDDSGINNANEDFYLIYLQPTSPLRNSKAIDKCFELMLAKSKNSLISVVANNFSPYKSFKIDKDGLLSSLFDQSLSNANRQDLPATYRANGAIYVFKVSEFKEINGFPSNKGIPYIMNEIDSLDIDNYEDLDKLKLELSNRKGVL